MQLSRANSKAYATSLSKAGHTHPRRRSLAFPAQHTSSPAYPPAPLGHVLSSLRFLGDNQPDILISLPLNPFPSQSSSPQRLKPHASSPPGLLFSLPLHICFRKQWVCSTPQNSSQNVAYPSTPTMTSLADTASHPSSPFLAPIYHNRTVTGSELCLIDASYPRLKILC